MYSKEFIKDVIQWDVGNWSKIIPFLDQYLPSDSNTKKVLTIGEREGGLSLFIAKKGFNVTCTDYNSFPQATPELHKKYEVDKLIELQSPIDMISLPYQDASYDVVVFKSVLGALGTKEKQQGAISDIYRVLKPDGLLLFAENAKGVWLHQFFRRFVGWASYWRYLDLRNDMNLFSQFSNVKFETSGFLATFGRTESQRNILAKIDKLVCKITPKKWHYISFFYCQK